MAILSPQPVCVFNGRVPLFAGLGSTRKALGVQSQQNVQENLWWKSFHYVFWWIWSLFHLMFEMPGWVALLTVWFSFTTAVSWTIWCIGILYPSSYSFAFKPPQHQWSLLQGKKNTLMNSLVCMNHPPWQDRAEIIIGQPPTKVIATQRLAPYMEACLHHYLWHESEET